MKPLNIEQLKSLEVGDWVWVKSLLEWDDYYNTGRYVEIDCIDEDNLCFVADCKDWEYRDYGETWLVYKNKEQAECKGEIVELIAPLDSELWEIECPKQIGRAHV